MNIEVTKDIVKILEQSENPHENEYKITTCYFTFDEFTSSFQVKRAIFTVLSTEEMYETDIINNQCDIPSEVLVHEYETVKLGVYGYNIGENEELLNRFSPSYAEFIVPTGSYKEGALSPEPITPSQYDLYSQALQEGLQEVDDKLDEVVETVDSKLEEVDDKLEVVDGKIQDMDDALDDVDTAITETNNLNLDVSDKVDGDVTVTLTKKDASTKSVVISDGTSLMFNWDGTKLGVKTDEDSEYVYVDLQGIQGVPGPQGEPFRIKKTYSSVAEMNADFNNMQYGDYVMIASTVEIEDNAKLYTRGEYQWIFITDFSGAQGIKGETGATPNIQIGTVTSGSTPSVTRTGTNENPVLNFVLQPGEKGNKGDTGATGNGIASITKTSTSGLVDTYTITFTSGNTTTFNVTNGNGIDHISLTSQSGATKVYTIYFTDGNTTTFTVQDGEVTQEVFDEEVDRLKMVYNAMPKVSGEGTNLTLDNTAECPIYDIELSPSELEQATTTGKNIALPTWASDFVTAVNDSTKAKLETKDSRNCLYYTANAGYGDYLNKNFTLGITFKEDTQYTISFDMLKKLDTTGTVEIFYKDGTHNRISANNTIDTWEHKTITSTANKTIAYICPYYTSGNTYIDIDTWQIEEGTTETSYEKPTYGASPNPQYPQEIHTVSGENSVKVGNKNLAKSDWVEDFVTAVNNNTKARLITNDDRNCLFYQPSAGYNNYDTQNFTLGTTFKENTQYTVSFDIKKTTNTSPTVAIRYTDDTFTTMTVTSSIDTWEHKKITSNSSKTIKYITPHYTAGDTFIDIDTWQIEEGTTATSYEEHKEQSLPLSLGDLEYCKIGDYEDEFVKGKNLFDKYNTIYKNNYYKNDSGVETSSSISGYTVSYIEVKPNTQYSYSGIFNKNNTAGAIYFYDKDKNWISRTTAVDGLNPIIFTTPSNCYYIQLQYTVSIFDDSTIMVNEGATALPYIPYGSGKWYLKKNIGKTTDTIGSTSKTISDMVSNATVYSYCGGTVSGTTITYTSALVVANYIYYPTTTPTYTLLSDTLQTQLDNIQKVISYQDQTNVSQTNADLPFVIKMSAIRDLSGIFELIQ